VLRICCNCIKTPRLFQLADRLSIAATVTNHQTEKIHLENLNGSATQFVVAATFLHPACAGLNHVIILNNAEEAAYFHNSLENLTDALDLFYFPSSFKNRKNFELLNASHVMLRTEALTKIASGGNKKFWLPIPRPFLKNLFCPQHFHHPSYILKRPTH
jgi:transcription-repair coupling factor (superfamily II helicase)